MVDSACGCDSVRVEKHMKEFSDANMLPGKGGGRGGGRGTRATERKIRPSTCVLWHVVALKGLGRRGSLIRLISLERSQSWGYGGWHGEAWAKSGVGESGRGYYCWPEER